MSKPALPNQAAAQNHESWIDSVRAAACLMVILLHVAAFYVLNAGLKTSDWAFANAIDSVTRVCVPLFFMISGYLFMGSRPPKPRHMVRVLSAIAFYSTIAIAFTWVTTGSLAWARIAALPYQPAFYHLWYLYSLLGIYLVASIISVRPAASGTSIVALCILMLLLNGSGITPDDSPLALYGKSIIYLLLAVSGAVLGQYLSGLDIDRKNLIRRAAFMAFCTFVVCIGVMTHIASEAAGKFVPDYYKYSHPFVVGAALSCFTWLRLVNISQIVQPIVGRVADNSLAIYGIHAFVLDLVRRAAKLVEQPAVIEIAWVFAVTVLFSYLLARVLRRIDTHKLFT